ncbi:MAG: MoaD/ThiS family protein [Desulfovibrio sp.]|uniref:MoaD/ThiS family protein n=1 Tax=Desulfovibrio sp. TaxID=885 RepID=UPI00258E9B59|nr:MoaD/ThiS family protein [Desulfovibrio sp.]MCD7984822.1 MoaD/ThiS family protein [Desulfovibrio sp.]
MRLNVKCFATLAEKSPPGGVCELPEGADAARLMLTLGVPAAEVKLIFINGVAAEPDAALHDGDRVGLFPAVGGG